MRIEVRKDYDLLSRAAATLVAGAIAKKRALVLALPTGATPLGMYKELISAHRAGQLDLSDVVTFNLDEYVGLPKDHPKNYSNYMRANFFDHVNIRAENIHIPDGSLPVPELHAYCLGYESDIAVNGGLDIAILGIGADGHIGFNEPNSPFKSLTRPVKLAEQTRRDNARFFGSLDEVPRHAITMGIATITAARTILLLASGEGKADILARSLEGPVSTEVPASFLQAHNDVIILADEAAASRLHKK